jgi:flavin-dependent dehydrogenase
MLGDTFRDAVVVGAGVAGSVAAAMLAQRGWRVLLVEKSSWPREKVCGGCLTANAASLLRQLGIEAPLRSAQPIHSLFWHAGRRSLGIPVPGEVAMLRADLDAAMVSEAMRRGCEFLPGASATLLRASARDSYRILKLQTGEGTQIIRAGIVLACDGIGGTLLAGESWAKWRIAPDSWIGVAATCQSSPWPIPPGEIHMHLGNAGYVGMVGMNGKLHLAASLDPAACRNAGGPARLVRDILASSWQAIVPEWHLPRLHGTGALTRRRPSLGGNRVLAVGDACGYVEPFTGEGMAWAVIGAREAVNLLPAPGQPWPAEMPHRWRRRHFQIVARTQRWCRGMRPILRHPEIAPLVIAVGNAMPAIGNWIAKRISQPSSRHCLTEFHHDTTGDSRFPQGTTQIRDETTGHRNGHSAEWDAGSGA